MMFSLLLLSISCIYFAACETFVAPINATQFSTQSKNIFGNDMRTPVLSTDYPWRAIGKLSTGCTGTLVGRDLVLTAAHCIIDPNTQYLVQDAINFYPNQIDGKSNLQASATYVWWGTNQPDKYRDDDWALIRLDKAIGDVQGWFCARRPSYTDITNVNGTLVGYSVNFRNGDTAGAHIGCKIVKESHPKFFLHNCDMGRGASGGPIFAYWDNEPCIYVLNVAEFRNDGDTTLFLPAYSDANANIAIWSNEIIDKIIEINSS